MIDKIKNYIEKRKFDIFYSSLVLADKYGISGITTKNLAKEIGFGEGALYKHVKSKSDIFLMILDISERVIIDFFNELDTRNMNAVEKLREWFDFSVEALQEVPGIYRVLFSDELYVKEDLLFKKFKDLTERLTQFLKMIIDEGKRDGLFKKEIDSYLSSMIFLGSFNTYFTIWNIIEERKVTIMEISEPVFNEYISYILA